MVAHILFISCCYILVLLVTTITRMSSSRVLHLGLSPFDGSIVVACLGRNKTR